MPLTVFNRLIVAYTLATAQQRSFQGQIKVPTCERYWNLKFCSPLPDRILCAEAGLTFHLQRKSLLSTTRSSVVTPSGGGFRWRRCPIQVHFWKAVLGQQSWAAFAKPVRSVEHAGNKDLSRRSQWRQETGRRTSKLGGNPGRKESCLTVVSLLKQILEVTPSIQCTVTRPWIVSDTLSLCL